MWPALRHGSALAIAVVMVGVAACDHADDLYGSGRDLAVPFGYFGTGFDLITDPKACSECVVAQCADLLQACMDAPSCAAYCECRDTVDDPSDNVGCQAYANMADDVFVTGFYSVPHIAMLRTDCVWGTCGEACRSPAGEPWSCLGNYGFDQGLFQNPAGDEVEFEVELRFYESNAVAEGARVRLCTVRDANCDDALDEAMSDADGMVTLSYRWNLFTARDQYLEITREADARSGAIKALWFPSVPSFNHGSARTFLLASEETARRLGGAAPEPGHGHLSVYGLDCMMGRVEGVELKALTADAQTQVTYSLGGALDPMADRTTRDGLAYASNMPASDLLQAVTLQESEGRVLALRQVLIRDGWYTHADAWPLTASEAEMLEDADAGMP